MTSNRMGKYPSGSVNRAMRFCMHGEALPAPVLHLKFGEGKGTSAKDSSPEGNDCTLIGPTWTTGIKGNAISLDGDNDYATVTRHASLEPSAITLTARFKFRTVVAWDRIHNKANVPGIKGYLITIDTEDRLTAVFMDGDLKLELKATGALIANIWYDGAAVCEADGDSYIYVNGVLKGSNTTTLSGLAHDTTKDLIIGKHMVLPLYYPDAVYDDIRIYPQALRGELIRQISAGIA